METHHRIYDFLIALGFAVILTATSPLSSIQAESDYTGNTASNTSITAKTKAQLIVDNRWKSSGLKEPMASGVPVRSETTSSGR